MIWMWLMGAAFAGNVYLNGTFIDPVQVAGLEMEDVDVRIDAEGNLHINAPGYKVEVMSPAAPGDFAAPAPAPASASTYAAPSPAGSAPAAPAPAGAGATYSSSYGAQPATTGAANTYPTGTNAAAGASYGAAAPVPAAPAVGMNPNGIAKASWWLVTEDNGSGGHRIDVHINDQLAHTLQSGQPQQIVDISAFLRKGSNQVVVKSSSAGGLAAPCTCSSGPEVTNPGPWSWTSPRSSSGWDRLVQAPMSVNTRCR